MRRQVLVTVFIVVLALGIHASDFVVNLNIQYNHGLGDFFETQERHLSYSGLNFIEKERNKMGMGFGISLAIPILKRFYLVPGAGMLFGNHRYQYYRADQTSDNDVDRSDYFYLYSAEMGVMYDLLALNNGWRISLLLGLNYNIFKPDAQTMLPEKKFWGFQSGLGARFFQLKHLGFQLWGYYKKAFDDERFTYLTAQSGISYRF